MYQQWGWRKDISTVEIEKAKIHSRCLETWVVYFSGNVPSLCISSKFLLASFTENDFILCFHFSLLLLISHIFLWRCFPSPPLSNECISYFLVLNTSLLVYSFILVTDILWVLLVKGHITNMFIRPCSSENPMYPFSQVNGLTVWLKNWRQETITDFSSKFWRQDFGDFWLQMSLLRSPMLFRFLQCCIWLAFIPSEKFLECLSLVS